MQGFGGGAPQGLRIPTMVNKIITGAVDGVDGTLVIVEVDISPGLPGTEIVGLPDSAVKESRERVRAAIRNS